MEIILTLILKQFALLRGSSALNDETTRETELAGPMKVTF